MYKNEIEDQKHNKNVSPAKRASGWAMQGGIDKHMLRLEIGMAEEHAPEMHPKRDIGSLKFSTYIGNDRNNTSLWPPSVLIAV